MSKSLFDLIKTLSKAEKRVFSEKIKNTKRMQFYTKIVAVYSKSDNYCIGIDRKIFKAENSKFISECKAKCKQLLYNYLVTLERNKAIPHQLEQQLKIAIMLARRKQFDESKKILKKIEPLAVKYECLEVLFKIRNEKLKLARIFCMLNKELDIEYVQSLTEDKKKSFEMYLELDEARDVFHLANLKISLNQHAIVEKSGNQKEEVHQVKKIGFKVLGLMTRFAEYSVVNNHYAALEEVEQLVNFVAENKDIVFKAYLAGLNYPSYILQYLEYALTLNRKVNCVRVLEMFDDIPTNSFMEKITLLNAQTTSYCIYALYENNPQLALAQIAKNEEFFSSNYIPENRHVVNAINLRFILIVYLALGEWDQCLNYITKMESHKISGWTASLNHLIKLICVYEKKDYHYFNSLINQHMVKRKKNKIKINDCTSFNECIFNLFYYLDKNSKTNLSPHLNKVFETFDYTYMELRYLIHWVVSKFPELNNEAYQAFLKKHNYKHFDFNAINKKKRNSVSSLVKL